MAIPLILAAAGRMAAGAAVRGAATAGARTAATAGARGAGAVARVKPAMTAPSGTLPNVARKTSQSNGVAKRVVASRLSSKSKEASKRATPLSNGENDSLKRNGVADQPKSLYDKFKSIFDDKDREASQCCETSNKLLESIDTTLKKMLSIQAQLAASSREADAEAKEKPAAGFGGLKEKAEEIKGDFFGALWKTGLMVLVTNLKPIAQYIGDVGKKLGEVGKIVGDEIGNLMKKAGDTWNGLVKSSADAWKNTQEGLGNWWNERQKEWNAFWGIGNDEEKPAAPQTPPIAPLGGNGAIKAGSTAINNALKPTTPSVSSVGSSAAASTPSVTATPSSHNSRQSFSAVIHKAEAGSAGYNAFNQPEKPSKLIKGPIGLTRMTVNQIIARQNAKELFAVGKYQIIPKTLKEAVEKMGLKGDELFNEELQERIFKEFLSGSKRPALSAYLSGQSNDINAAMLDAAKEWAGLPDPRTGKSYYAGDGRNKANVSIEEVRASLEADRARNLAALSEPKTQLAQAPQGSEKAQPVVVQTTGASKQSPPPQVVASPDGEQLMSRFEQFRAA